MIWYIPRRRSQPTLALMAHRQIIHKKFETSLFQTTPLPQRSCKMFTGSTTRTKVTITIHICLFLVVLWTTSTCSAQGCRSGRRRAPCWVQPSPVSWLSNSRAPELGTGSGTRTTRTTHTHSLQVWEFVLPSVFGQLATEVH